MGISIGIGLGVEGNARQHFVRPGKANMLYIQSMGRSTGVNRKGIVAYFYGTQS